MISESEKEFYFLEFHSTEQNIKFGTYLTSLKFFWSRVSIIRPADSALNKDLLQRIHKTFICQQSLS